MTSEERRYVRAVGELRAACMAEEHHCCDRGGLSYELSEAFEGLQDLGQPIEQIRDLHRVGVAVGDYLIHVRSGREAASWN